MVDLHVQAAKKNEQAIIGNLLQYYLHDFSCFDHVPIEPDGSFSYPYLKHYWQDPDRFPYLFRRQDQLIGFGLLRLETGPVGSGHQMDMAEFFILRSFRRNGSGTFAARALWDLFPGSWQIRVLRANKAAYQFWKPLIASYTQNNFREDIVDNDFYFRFNQL